MRNATAQISADGVTVSCGFRPDSDADSCLVILTKPIDSTYVLFVVIPRAPGSADVVSCLVTSLLPGMYRAYAYAAWGASFGVPEVEFNFQWVAAQGVCLYMGAVWLVTLFLQLLSQLVHPPPWIYIRTSSAHTMMALLPW